MSTCHCSPQEAEAGAPVGCLVSFRPGYTHSEILSQNSSTKSILRCCVLVVNHLPLVPAGSRGPVAFQGPALQKDPNSTVFTRNPAAPQPSGPGWGQAAGQRHRCNGVLYVWPWDDGPPRAEAPKKPLTGRGEPQLQAEADSLGQLGEGANLAARPPPQAPHGHQVTREDPAPCRVGKGFG